MIEHPSPTLGYANTAHPKTSDEANAVMWLRYMLVYANRDGLYLGRAVPRAWFRGPEPFGAEGVRTVYGTAGDDAFQFEAQPPVGSGLQAFQREITINGVRYVFPFQFPLFSATFEGGEGDDTAVLHAGPGADTAQLWPGSGVLDGGGYHVTVDDVESITVQSGGGVDVAMLHDRPGGADTFKATPAYARLFGDGFDNRVESFRYAHGYGTPGDLDVALLHGDPRAVDRFEAWPEMARLLGNAYYNRVKSFRYVHAYGNVGDGDFARFFGRSGEYDRFEAWPEMARMYAHDYYNRAKSFRRVEARSSFGEPDEAFLWDSALNDLLVAQNDEVRLESASSSLDFLCQVSAFDTVTATSTTGNDTARVAPEVDFLLLYGNWNLEPWSINHPTSG